MISEPLCPVSPEDDLLKNTLMFGYRFYDITKTQNWAQNHL